MIKAFIDAVDLDTLYHLILASNYLGIDDLLDLCCARVAKIIRTYTKEDLREKFNLPEVNNNRQMRR